MKQRVELISTCCIQGDGGVLVRPSDVPFVLLYFWRSALRFLSARALFPLPKSWFHCRLGSTLMALGRSGFRCEPCFSEGHLSGNHGRTPEMVPLSVPVLYDECVYGSVFGRFI